MIIYLVLLLPAGSSDLPKAWRAAFISLLFGLASNGVYMCHCCYQQCGSLLHCLSTLTSASEAVYFCCTGLGVTSTGRYPASCPVKPGLSSSGPFRLSSRDHLAWLRIWYFSTGTQTCKVCFFTLPCGRMATQVAFQCGKCEGRRSQSSEARTQCHLVRT